MAAVFPIGGVAQLFAKPISFIACGGKANDIHSETNEEVEADTKRARLWPKEQHGRWSGVENLGERRARAVMIPRQKRREMPRGKQMHQSSQRQWKQHQSSQSHGIAHDSDSETDEKAECGTGKTQLGDHRTPKTAPIRSSRMPMAAAFPSGGVAQPSAETFLSAAQEARRRAAELNRTKFGYHRFQGRQKEYVAQPPARTRKRTRALDSFIAMAGSGRKRQLSPGLVCQECHRLIDRPLAVNRCPLCKVDLHADCLDVNFLLVHKESFERWNKNTLEASSLFGTSSRASPFPSNSTLSLQCALH